MAVRVPRPVAEMARALRTHVSLLERYIHAVNQGDDAFLGEIAGKLRLLVVDKGGNQPLLRRLADLTGDELTFVLGGPPIQPMPGQPAAGDTISVETYLGMVGVYVRNPRTGDLDELTYGEMISTWAQQYGAAHEDWSLLEAFHESLAMRVEIGGVEANARTLLGAARTVLNVAGRYLAGLTDDKIDAAEAELRHRQGRPAPPA